MGRARDAGVDIEIGDALPTDLGALVDVHGEAFAGTLGAALGPRYVEGLFRWYLREPGARTLVARRDGALAGYVFGAPDGHWDRFNRALAPRVLAALARRPTSLLHPQFLGKIPLHLRSLIGATDDTAEVVPEHDRPVYDLCGIGVAPGQRQKGVARCLMAHFEGAAWAAGFRSILLSVHSDNGAARRLYESRGWRTTADDGHAARYRISGADAAGVRFDERGEVR